MWGKCPAPATELGDDGAVGLADDGHVRDAAASEPDPFAGLRHQDVAEQDERHERRYDEDDQLTHAVVEAVAEYVPSRLPLARAQDLGIGEADLYCAGANGTDAADRLREVQQPVRVGRDYIDFFLVEVSFNGAVTLTQ